jgi:CBS domain-containing protein
MQAKDLMTTNPTCCSPDDTLETAARLMREHDCGSIPVCEHQSPEKVVGMITDRDIAVRAVAEGRGPDTPIRGCMSPKVHTCSPDSTAEEIEDVMSTHQVRRVPIIDTDGRLLGIIAQADLALSDDPRIAVHELAEVVQSVSRPERTRGREEH